MIQGLPHPSESVSFVPETGTMLAMTELRKIETLAEPGNWILLVSQQGTAVARILDDDTVRMKRYGEDVAVSLARLSAFAEALAAYWLDGAEDGLGEFRAP